MPFIAIALLVAAALGGGVSVAAQNSLPGDALWGFKTGVNEQVTGAFSAGDEAKADWDISIIKARLEEAQRLAAKGALSANVQADLSANFDAHAEDIASRVAKLQASGKADIAAQVATRFQAALAQSATAVADASAHSETTVQATLDPLLTDIRGTLDAAANLNASASAQTNPPWRPGPGNGGTPTGGTGSSDGSATSSTGSTGPGVQVHTGTSVQGGQGGIQTNTETGSTIGI